MSSRLNVLIPDGDSTWALSVLQCLSHIEDYKLFVLSNEKRTATKYSKYTAYYKFYERSNEASWLDIINSEVETNSISVILPIAEAEVLFFISNRSKISRTAKVIPLPKLRDFETAINKYKLSEFCKAHNISHPRSFLIASEKEKQDVLSKIHFPILIKPLSQKGGDGIEKVQTISEIPERLEHIKSPAFVQEYIEGYDIDCSVLCQDGEVLTYTVQKGNLPGHNEFAPQLGFDFLQNEEVINIAKEVMSLLNWFGVAHLDMRFDKATNSYCLIEINARFWGSIDGSRHAGVNFPHLAIQCALKQPVMVHAFNNLPYMRLKGVLKYLKRNPLFLFKRKFLLEQTETKSFLKDPLPTMYKFREWLGRQF
ncbi:ATP-grasp domain-containing protein [uncultured Psychroserpens sp.]|uniref:ATP-grasp domain-containing protein n=1 Tax=uncultured Psychroserpens sp. TaxID=255436 RepID=UPI00262C83B8|nr:ATP-grasp domain-containing protein [uncultured Psychroserpens sp.]